MYVVCFDARCLNDNNNNKPSSWQWDDSHTSIVLSVETFRIPRAEGCGPLGGANI